MRIICRQNAVPIDPIDGVAFSLFEQPRRPGVGRVGATIPQRLRSLAVYPSSRAWDFLAIALSVAAADLGCLRKHSPDGWTREIRLDVSVTNPGFWDTQREALEAAVRFLTGDIWQLSFVARWCRSAKKDTIHSPKARQVTAFASFRAESTALSAQ